MQLGLSGRAALVCGASAGIGRAVAVALGGLGCRVIALARREDALADVCRAALAAGAPSAEPLVADLDDTKGLRAATRGLRAEILIHNTGGPPGGRLLDEPTSKLEAAFRRHVLSAQVLVQALLPAMLDAGYGRVVTVTSTSVREPLDHLGVSNTIRAAMAGWAKTLSRELPPGITINNVLPGYTATERLEALKAGAAARSGGSVADVEAAWRSTVPEGRFAEPEELAAVIAFLCSPAASYVRGVSLPVDGGRLRSI
ncbi:MAG TPA: SDR family oxidoreductase [Myxococcota bacterium]|nr:SDR family oxidoreductase [Myxococcota bacterium]